MNWLKKNVQKIGHKFLEWKSKGLNRVVKTRAYDDIKEVLILYYIEDLAYHQDVLEFEKVLQKDHKNVTLIAYYEHPEILPPMNKELILLGEKDLSKWNGTLISDEVTDILTRPIEMLINLDRKNTFALEYISVLSEASFKVGSNHDYRNSPLDLVIETDSKASIKTHIGEVMKYLKMIKTNE